MGGPWGDLAAQLGASWWETALHPEAVVMKY